MLTLLFKESGVSVKDLFHEAVIGDKVLADTYLKLLTAAQEESSFQQYVFRDVNDFKKVLGLSNAMEFLESCI